MVLYLGSVMLSPSLSFSIWISVPSLVVRRSHLVGYYGGFIQIEANTWDEVDKVAVSFEAKG